MAVLTQLEKLKALLGGSPPQSDTVLQIYLDNASDIICEIRNSNVVESQYSNIQLRMAVEMVSKEGAEGQLQHTENGIARVYEASDISPSLLGKITPFVKTPFSTVRDVTV